MSVEYAFPLVVSASRDTHGSGEFCHYDLNRIFGELRAFGRMQSCFSVRMCFIFGEGRAFRGIHNIYDVYRVYYIYHMYVIQSIKPHIL